MSRLVWKCPTEGCNNDAWTTLPCPTHTWKCGDCGEEYEIEDASSVGHWALSFALPGAIRRPVIATVSCRKGLGSTAQALVAAAAPGAPAPYPPSPGFQAIAVSDPSVLAATRVVKILVHGKNEFWVGDCGCGNQDVARVRGVMRAGKGEILVNLCSTCISGLVKDALMLERKLFVARNGGHYEERRVKEGEPS